MAIVRLERDNAAARLLLEADLLSDVVHRIERIRELRPADRAMIAECCEMVYPRLTEGLKEFPTWEERRAQKNRLVESTVAKLLHQV